MLDQDKVLDQSPSPSKTIGRQTDSGRKRKRQGSSWKGNSRRSRSSAVWRQSDARQRKRQGYTWRGSTKRSKSIAVWRLSAYARNLRKLAHSWKWRGIGVKKRRKGIDWRQSVEAGKS